MRVPLVDGQGNFGSIDGDPPAAERYTEVRLSKIAQYMLDDLDKATVDFRGNYDDRLQEPVVLPAKFPNLLVNGSGGIAVGMATNIPPHNLGEVIDACIAHLDNPEIGIEELCQIVPGPDFPTGGHDPGPRRHHGRLPQGPRLHHAARQGAHRGDPQGPRGADRHRHSLSGEQARADREDQRADARQGVRGRVGDLGRIEPGRHAHRHRAEARCDRRRGAEPALAPLGPADELRRQHAGDQRRTARAAQSQGHDQRVHRPPRGGGEPAHQVPARQVAGPGARVGGPCRGGRQHRRDDPSHPRRAEPGGGPRADDGRATGRPRTSGRWSS